MMNDAKIGGMSNAYTAEEHTNYFFDVQHEHLEEVLDRFAQFFIAPLFTESATAREMQAVRKFESPPRRDRRSLFSTIADCCLGLFEQTTRIRKISCLIHGNPTNYDRL